MGHGPSDAFSDPKTMAANGHSPVKRKLSSYWLVVSIPLTNMKVSWDDYSQDDGKPWFQTTNQ